MQDQPRGTVTFLFTDIEGSTRLWQDFPETLPAAYARHDAILREAVGDERGVVFKVIGDAFQVAFPTAVGGVIAALRAQQALTRERWGLPEPLKVRMALHTGAVDPDDDGDYRSPVLNRLGRLLSAGHGGQVLISQATMELARDHLPAGAAFLDLGDQRLKDLYRSERVFQLEGPDLRIGFPALRTLDTRSNNLPTQMTQFIGREEDVRVVSSLIIRDDVRLVTLTGPGGIGKTRLSLQVAADMLDTFVHGVYFVPLDALTDASLVPMAIAQALGLQEDSDAPILATLTSFLRDKRALLVLDNLEQVIDTAVGLSDLLVSCPGLKMLATSRIRLHIGGEQEFPVQPLALPGAVSREDVAAVSQYESVRLFVERARLVKPSFEVNAENAPAIAEICTRLDGLPLAIELAAARIRMLPPDAMLRRLTARLSLLTGGARNLPARQQTIRGAIGWSYDLLSPEDQALFRRMAVFAGGATFEAIEAVAADEDHLWDAFDGLERLVDQSLVRQVDGEGESRFTMYETIREYALAELTAHGEADDAFRRHARYITNLVDGFRLDLDLDEMVEWLDRVEAEADNLRVAMGWLIGNDPPGAYHLIMDALRFWQWRGHRREGKAWLEQVLALPRDGVHDLDLANALRGCTIFVGQPEYTARCLERTREAVAICRDIGDDYWLTLALSTEAIVIQYAGDNARAMEVGGEALVLARTTGDPQLIANMLNNMANHLVAAEHLAEADVTLREMLAILERIPNTNMASFFLHTVADYHRLMDDLDRAEGYYLKALPGAITGRFVNVIRLTLIALAVIASATGRYAQAAWLGGVEAAQRPGGDVLLDSVPEIGPAMGEMEGALAVAADYLGPEAYLAARRQGAAVSLEAVVATLVASRAEARL